MRIFELFKKGYNTVIGSFGGRSYYETKYETYIKSVYRNPSVASAYEKLESAYNNIEFKVFKESYKKVDNKKVMSFAPSENKVVNMSLKNPSRLLSRIDFSEYLLFYHLFGGRVLIEKVNGFISDELLMYAPNTYEIEYDEHRPIIKKIVIGGTKEVAGKDLDRFFIMKSLDPSSQVAGVGAGSSKLEALAGLTDMVNFIIKHNVTLLANNGTRKGFFKVNSQERMTQREKEELESKLKSAIQGYQNAGKTALLPNNVEFTATDNVPSDLDWTTGWEIAHKMIASILGVPFSMVTDSSSTYNNSKEDKVKLYKNTVIPLAKKHAEFLTKVFADRLSEGEFIWFDVSAIEELREETMETMKALEQITYLSINQKREVASELTGIELGRYNHENADKIFIGMNEVPIDYVTDSESVVNEEE